MPTIRDVAKACGVSPMTVSFVLNNKPGEVSEDTRDRVLRAMRELDYRPGGRQREAAEREILTLGLVAGVEGHSLMEPGYYQAIANGIVMAADRQRHNVTLFTHSIFQDDPRQSLRVYCDGRCDGLMVLAPRRHCDLVTALHERGFPFVLIGDNGDDPAISYVDIDNVTEGYRSTEYLIGLGHRRIAFVGGPEFVRSAGQRHEGYCRALAAHGLPLDSALDLTPILRPRELEEQVRRMMQRPAENRPTAIFGWNDGTAVKSLQIVQSLGLNVPRDVSIIGIDDDVLAQTAHPTLTTTRQPYEEIGMRVMDIVIRQIRGGIALPQRVLLATHFLPRHSTAPPAGSHTY